MARKPVTDAEENLTAAEIERVGEDNPRILRWESSMGLAEGGAGEKVPRPGKGEAER